MLESKIGMSAERSKVDSKQHKGDKSDTYNRVCLVVLCLFLVLLNDFKPWSTEEQKRLEELLLIYPPEPIELRRFKKIAAALGNRTAKQVTSRVQKYFLKLYKEGLPIPGRIPKSKSKYKVLNTQIKLYTLFVVVTFFLRRNQCINTNVLISFGDHPHFFQILIFQ